MFFILYTGCSRCVQFNTLPLPFTPPNTSTWWLLPFLSHDTLLITGTPYDISQFKQPDEVLLPGQKFNFYRQLLYFYSNHTDVRLPVSVAGELLPPTRPTMPKNHDFAKRQRSQARPRPPSYPECADSARPTDNPSCCSIVTHLDNLLLWACGPDQRTLGVCIWCEGPSLLTQIMGSQRKGLKMAKIPLQHDDNLWCMQY